MHQTRASLERLLKNSTDASFDEERIKGSIRLNSQSDVELIQSFENGEFSGISFQTPSLSYAIGNEINYTLSLHYDENQYASYQNFLQHHLEKKSFNFTSLDYIIYEEFYLKNKDENYISLDIYLTNIIEFIQCLSSKYYYRDNQIIIFAKNHCEIPIQKNDYQNYLDIAKNYSENQHLLGSLLKFSQWLNSKNEIEDEALKKSLAVHESERYAIAASEFVDYLTTYEKPDRIFKLLKNIDSIFQSTLTKYFLYLDDFKYSKFNDKIAKHADDFLLKVNKVISDLQNQILAIPMAAAILATFKPNTPLNIFIYIAFFIYSAMVFYATSQQTYNLKQITNQINEFIEENKIPLTLVEKWNKEIYPINQKIKWHWFYLIIVYLFIIAVMIICAYKLSSHLI